MDTKEVMGVNKVEKLAVKLADVKETIGQTAHRRVDNRLIELGLTGPNVPVVVAVRREGKSNMEVALENQRFYLEMEAMDKGDEGKPWQQFPKEDRVYGEMVFITPEMAAKIVEKYNKCNRNVIKSQVAKYARDMVEGNWFETAEAVQFDIHGNLVDGQHRLYGLIAAYEMANRKGLDFVGCPLFCAWDVPPQARYVVDSGVARSEGTKVELLFGDDIGIPKYARTKQFFSICRAMMNGIKDRANMVYSHSELAFFGGKYAAIIGEVMRDLRGVGAKHGIKRADVIAALAKAYLWYGAEKVRPFCERLGSIQFEGKDDPAMLLYSLVHRGGKQFKGLPIYKKTLSAIEHALKGNKINKLRERDEDFFDWIGYEWDVPIKMQLNKE